MKIWGKVMVEDKMVKNVLYESALLPTPQNYKRDLQEICYLLDVTTPVSLPTHYNHFIRFNRIKYIPRDFIDEVDFTALILEFVKDPR